jgi:phosphoribosyl 1,2-cyclic phosphate phosphodiesterase
MDPAAPSSAGVELTFLGTGTSFGVPVIGCTCGTCVSDDPRDRRTRHAALVRIPGSGTLLVDTPPELRLQLVAAGVRSVDAVWLTHLHADHLHGIDDLRIFSLRERRSVPVHAPRDTVSHLVRRFDYIFDPGAARDEGTSPPELTLHPVDPGVPVELLGTAFHPIQVPHGSARPLGFRVGELGYVTDAKHLPPAALETLRGVRLLVLNALWHGDPHPNHMNVEEAVEAARTVGAETTFLTHMTHRIRHAELARSLPPEVRPAHDGLTLRLRPGHPLTLTPLRP